MRPRVIALVALAVSVLALVLLWRPDAVAPDRSPTATTVRTVASLQLQTTSAAAEPIPTVDPVSGTHATSRDEWDQAFRRVSDYDALARSALNAALARDGRAALTLGRILRRCVTTMRYVRAEARAGRVPVARPEGLVDSAMFDRCQRLGADGG